jgi:hypothetical protein
MGILRFHRRGFFILNHLRPPLKVSPPTFCRPAPGTCCAIRDRPKARLARRSYRLNCLPSSLRARRTSSKHRSDADAARVPDNWATLILNLCQRLSPFGGCANNSSSLIPTSGPEFSYFKRGIHSLPPGYKWARQRFGSAAVRKQPL